MALDNMYGGAGLAFESIDPFGMGIALVVNGGVPVVAAGEVGPGVLAVEGELTFTVVPGETSGLEASLMTLGAYGAYILDISPEMYVKPRVGLIYKSIDLDYDYGWGHGTASDSEIGLALGVQGGYKINETLDAVVGLNLVDGADIVHFTAGVNYKF
jgi:hypothetical protein